MTRSVLDASTHIGRSALVEGAIVGRACDFRAHARVHEGVAIGDNVTLGAESVVFPGVRIYPYKEVETGRADPREPDLGVARGSRLFGGDGIAGLVNVDLTPEVAIRLAAALGTALEARRAGRREPGPGARLPDGEARDHHGADLDRRGRRRPARAPAAGRRHMLKMHAYDAGIHVGTSATDPEVVQIRSSSRPGSSCRRRSRRRSRSTSCARSCGAPRTTRWGRSATRAGPRELRAGPPRHARRPGDPRPRLPRRRRLRLLGRVVRAPARPRPARRRGGLGPRLHDRWPTRGRRARARARRADERLVAAVGADLGVVLDRAAERLYLIDETGQARCRSSRRCSSSCACSSRTAIAGKLAFPITVTSLVDRSSRAAASRSCGRRRRSPT